jgi:hypothetical protein
VGLNDVKMLCRRNGGYGMPASDFDIRQYGQQNGTHPFIAENRKTGFITAKSRRFSDNICL